MVRPILIAAVSATSLVAAVALSGCDRAPYGSYNRQGQGAWTMGRGGAGPYDSMMGPGYAGCWGGGMMGGPGGGYNQQPLNLSVGDVKANLERWIAITGNPRLKVGAVTEKDANSITADIVTQDNSLVQRLAFDRRTGFSNPVR